ncbi:hypothetical protein ACFVFS_26460 [Kitasatospora sp. NPDC057692]|uniref:hypothetical protein n=1 Tax=Kitasatospora sp. NPDC057692 TaxID=3346215 RepID=UPI003691E327
MIHVLHPDRVLCGLAANPALPADLVDRLIALVATTDDPSLADDLAAELADRDDLGPAQTRALACGVDNAALHLAHDGRLTAEDVDPATRPEAALALLERGEGRPAWVRRFAADPDPWRRGRLAGCPDLPEDVLRRLAEDPDPEVVADLAVTAPPALATALARHPHTAVRRAVAANDRTPPAVLAALLTGDTLPPADTCPVCERHTVPFEHAPDCGLPDCPLPPGAACSGGHESAQHEIAAAVLAHPATPASAAAGFADHPSALLRAELAARTDLPADVHHRLATAADPRVREALAENPAIDEEVIRALAEDDDADVGRALAHHPRLPLDVLTRLSVRTRTGSTLLPRIATASAAEVARLAASPEPAVRMLVAERRDLPPAIRDVLAADPDAKVLKAIAPHPGLSEPLLRAMVARHGVRVAARVATNPDASPALLADLALHRPPVQKALRAIAAHPRATTPALTACLADRQARPVAAAHPSLPPDLLVELLGDPLPGIAEIAAANPALPPAVARTLLTRYA